MVCILHAAVALPPSSVLSVCLVDWIRRSAGSNVVTLEALKHLPAADLKRPDPFWLAPLPEDTWM